MKNETIRLGLMPPLTGVVGLYGDEIERAGRIACDEINQNGGLLGKKLQLFVEDDGSLPETAVSAAEKLVYKHRCHALIGNLLSNSRIAVAYRVAEPEKIPLLNFSFYEGSILSRYFFHFAALPNQQIDKMIPFMHSKYGGKMYFAGNNYEWPRGSIHAAKSSLRDLGGEILGEEYCPLGVDMDIIEGILDRVEKTSPDVFVPYFAGQDQVNLLTEFTRRGLKNKIAVVMGHYDEMMASQLSPEVREGFYSSNTYFMSIDTEENRKYLSKMREFPGVTGIWPEGNGILTNFGEGTYLCVKAFAEAVNQSQSVNSEDLISALSEIKLDSPQGRVEMEPKFHHAAVNTYLSRCRKDGVFEIIERFGKIDPVLPERYKHQRITRQATLEEDIRLQARMLEQMGEAILLINASDSSIVYMNTGAEKMFEYSAGELLGRPVTILADPEDPVFADTAAEQTQILNYSGMWNGELKYKTRSGKSIWCSASVSTFTHPVHGEVWLGVYRDISQLKDLQEKWSSHTEDLEKQVQSRTADLNIAKENAEQANKAKNEFLSRMSHELRTPLNAILGFAQVLTKEGLESEHAEYVREIKEAGNHLLYLISDLLDLSRIESGKMSIVITPVKIKNSVQEALRFLEEQIGERNITVTNTCNESLTILADRMRLRQVLINLISNACKYNKIGGEINIYCSRPSREILRISVADTGHGIPANKMDRLFVPFDRMGAELTGVDGSGIGLALAKQLIEMMAGKIGVSSSSLGSTFWVDIPLENPDEPDVSSGTNHSGEMDTPKSILYIEDISSNIRVMEAIMNRHPDYELISSKSPRAGIQIAKTLKPSVILLDIKLPEISGYEVLEMLKKSEETKSIPVIALSADAIPKSEYLDSKNGFAGYYTKPVDIEGLLSGIRNAVQNTESIRPPAE